MYITYNGFDFAPGECNLNLFRLYPRRSERGFRTTNIAEAHCSGEFCLQPGEDEYDLATRVQALVDAIRGSGDFALKHSNGTNTPYQLLNSDPLNLTGVSVTHYEGPASANGEWATGGAFRFVVRAEYSAPESLLLDYTETIEHTGDTGSLIRWGQREDTQAQEPFWRVAEPSTTQRIIQKGEAVSLGTYLLPTPPILARPYLLGHLTQISRTSPKRYPNGTHSYRTSWQYQFVSPVPVVAFPTIR